MPNFRQLLASLSPVANPRQLPDSVAADAAHHPSSLCLFVRFSVYLLDFLSPLSLAPDESVLLSHPFSSTPFVHFLLRLNSTWEFCDFAPVQMASNGLVFFLSLLQYVFVMRLKFSSTVAASKYILTVYIHLLATVPLSATTENHLSNWETQRNANDDKDEVNKKIVMCVK